MKAKLCNLNSRRNVLKLYVMPKELRETLARLHEHLYSYVLRGSREYVGMTLRAFLHYELFRVYVVGDYVCRTFEMYVGIPKLCIADMKTMRNLYECPTQEAYNTVISCRNPAGTISGECIEKLSNYVDNRHSHTLLLVEGEEDLLGLAILLRASHGYLVYGIPKAGVAVAPIESGNKVRALNIFSRFIEQKAIEKY